MSRGPTTFRQRDVAALIKAARAAGCVIARIEVGKDGLIKLVLRGDATHPPEPAAGCTNEWDDILK